MKRSNVPDDPARQEPSAGSRRASWIAYGAGLAGAALVLADLLYHKHGHFTWEEWIGFHAWYGFVGSVVLVLAARPLRRILMRPEDYYD